jgi:hypothetical protein
MRTALEDGRDGREARDRDRQAQEGVHEDEVNA